MIRRIFERVSWVGVVAIVAIVIAGAITYSRLVASMQAEDSSQLAARLIAASRARHIALVSAVTMSGIAVALVVLLVLVGRRAAHDIRRHEQWLATRAVASASSAWCAM